MLIPTTFLFRYQVAIHRRAVLPGVKGALLGLGSESRLPWLVCKPEVVPFADVRMAWNENGLGLQIEVDSRTVPLNHSGLHSKNAPSINIWIDTRPTPDSHRAGRYCSQWRIHPERKGSNRREPIVEAVAISRAREESVQADADAVLINCETRSNGYLLEAWFARESLPGFDPEASSKLGFFYLVEEPELGIQMPWEAGGFPVESDPSLWVTLLLEE